MWIALVVIQNYINKSPLFSLQTPLLQKTTKSVDTSDRPVNNNKPFKSIISLDSTTSTIESTIQLSKDHIDNSHNKKLAPNHIDSINESMTKINQTSPTEYMNGDGGCGGSNSNRNENNVISKDEDGGCNAGPAIEMNNKYQQITIDKSNANSIQLNNSNSDDDIGSNRQLELNNKDDKMETRCGNRNDDINSGREHSFDSGE